MTNLELKNKLQEIADQKEITIEKEVAIEALYREDDIKTFFSDLLQFGCICGMIESLVYTSDTHNFYDSHYYEIEELREEFENSIGEPIPIKGDLKNFFTWFAFEQTAYKMANEFELGI